MKQVRVPLHLIVLDPDQPRKAFPKDKIADLKENIERIGQQVPGIGYQHEGKVILVDGHCRLHALMLAGKPDMQLILLPERPTKLRLQIIRHSLDAHRLALNPVERANLLAEIQKESGWGTTELASQVSLPQSTVSKLLACHQKLAPEVQELLATGALDIEKAVVLSRIDDRTAQVAMAKEAAHLSRESLLAKVKNKGHAQPKVGRAVFLLPSGMSVTVAGRDVSLDEAIDGLQTTVKELRRGLAQGLDISTVQRVLKGKAKQNDPK